MSTIIIVTICTLLLLAYIFDISSSKTKIPSVILLILLGWGVKQFAVFWGISIPNLDIVLPVLGTIGLILIVLEGSLELEIKRSKFPVVIKSSLVAFFPMLLMSIGLAFAFYYFDDNAFKNSLANAIPFAIISSAIAIPSAKNLRSHEKEFITYESSLSDIFGLIFFNFITLNDNIGSQTFSVFLLQLLVILIVSFISTLTLALLLSKIKHSVKFAPIILLIILIYSISKIYHLPSLLFILFFGLFIGNLDELKRFKLIDKLQPDILDKEVRKFKELTIEMTFLVRSLFFLLFGFLIEYKDLFNPGTIIWAIIITACIYLIRVVFIKIVKLPVNPLLFIAPRGLITILLFLSIPENLKIDIVNESLILQVIFLTAIVMMFGLMNHKKEAKN
ncbi:MAG: cation:proton antiporter [Bacteroidales bacterium]|nr:cation:proton antiporter [Bacteroidales bacterium]